MAGLFDGLNKAVSKLQDLGGKAVDGAKELAGKASPELKEGIDKVTDGAKDLADRVADGAKALRDKVAAPSAAEPPKDLFEQIDREVREQVKQMREAAANSDDPIHAFFQAQRQAKTDAAQAAEDPAAAALA